MKKLSRNVELFFYLGIFPQNNEENLAIIMTVSRSRILYDQLKE